MSIAHNDTGNVRELHTKASDLSCNFRDASGGTGGTRIWKTAPTPIRTLENGANPYSRRITMLDARQVEGRDGKAGSSNSSRPSEAPSRQTTKRRKLEHPQGDASRYFPSGIPSRRDSLAIPSASTSFRPSSATATASRNAMIIDAEGGTPDDSHEPIMLRTSSPDPVDVIHPNVSYVFDQNKPSPIHTFSYSPNERRKSPLDFESTLRVRNALMKATESVSRPDSDDDNVRRLSKILPGLLSRNESTVEAQAPSSRGNLKEKMALYERSQLRSPLTHFDLPKLVQTRKNGMKLKQVPRRDPPALPIQHLDPGTTRPSGFASSSALSSRKAAESGVFAYLPLKECPIAVAIPEQEVTNLVWEAGVQKVRHVDGDPTLSESQVKKGSLDSVKYVDIKRNITTHPLIQTCPSVVTYVQNRRNVRNATTADFPGISHTPASAMDRTHIVGSSYRPIPRDAGVVHKDEGGIKREGAETEKDILSLIIMARSGTAGDHADVAERTHDATVQHTKVATHKNRGMIKEKLGREEKGPHKITLSNVEAGRISVGERMAVAEVTFEDQDQDGAEIEQMDPREELARDEGRYNKLMKQEMEIRGRKQKAEILEEILQTREKDLCHHLETVREMLQVVRQKKMSIERQEGSLRQKLVDARREHGLEETSDPKLATMREIQGVGVEVEAGAPSEE